MSMLNPLNVTLLTMKQRILRPTGKQDDPNSQAAAGDIIQSIVDTLNAKRDWKSLRNVGVYNVTTDGILTLSNSTNARFKKIYDVWTADKKLDYLPQRDYDMLTAGATTFVPLGSVTAYTAFNIGQGGYIQLRDPPGAAMNVTVNAQMLMTMPASDNATFSDVPEFFGNYIFCEGRARCAGEVGREEELLAYWSSLAKDALADIIRNDQNLFPDHIAQFIPQSAVLPPQTNKYGYVYNY